MEGYEWFKEKIHKKTGINLSLYKERQMKRRIESLIRRHNYKDYDSYYNALIGDQKLLNEFVTYLTINVSEFFRNIKQWDVLRDNVLPVLIDKNKKGKLKIWSAACSTGEEPYTTVMLLTKYYNLKDIEVIATDIDDKVLDKAKLGMYSEKAIEGIPKEFRDRYVKQEGNKYIISDEIKSRVKFLKHNLLKDSYPSNCDLIICRNVLIYFTEEAKDIIYQKFNDSLKPDGVLFVGSTEQIIMPQKYNFASLKTFFYKKI